jgi:Uma2 family endonuclease
MGTAVAKRRFTVEEYHRMAEAGVFPPQDRLELLGGEIIEMSPIGKAHAVCVDRLTRRFVEIAARRAIVRVQNPIQLGPRSEPQPDLALLRPREDDYAGSHPGPTDILLVVEVADTSQDYDRGNKIPAYAEAGIPEAWLVDLRARAFEIYREPAPGGYHQLRRVSSSEFLAPSAFPDARIEAAEILRGL